MKFWQYALGGILALLIFAAVVIADNMQFAERSTFSQNPFSLIKTSRTSFGGEMRFLPSGEMIWIDDDSEVLVTETERRLEKGIVAVGGTFFSTPEDIHITNKLWFGNAELHFEKATALVQLDTEGIATVLSGGGSLDLLFTGIARPFIIPVHSRVTFDTKKRIQFDPYDDYFTLQQELMLEPITTGDLAETLWSAEEALAEWRTQFGHFAWNLPILWDFKNGAFLQFLEKFTLRLPAEKRAARAFQENTYLLRKAHEAIDKPLVEDTVTEFREKVLDTESWKSILAESDRFYKEWQWFEAAQKIWLPVVSPDANQQKFSLLWKHDAGSLQEKMQAVMLLSHNERWFRAEVQIENFLSQFLSTEFSKEDLPQITRFRREMVGLLHAFPKHQSLAKFKIWGELVRKEHEYITEDIQRKFSKEIAHTILDFVPGFFMEKSGSEISKLLNEIWFEYDFEEKKEISFSEAELTIIENINLVGVSGMTLEQAQKALEQKREQDLIESQLNELLSKEKPPEKEKKEIIGIANAKKLWEFLASQKIELDISAFRTKRTETSLTTRFANTETGKRKIEGIFDYYAQKFITLTLGEETTADLSAHRLGRWIKNIGGKFETNAPPEATKENETGVLQTTPQAILGKKLVQELLRSFLIEVKRSDLEMKDDEYQRCGIARARYNGAIIDAEYNVLTQEFSRISVQKGEKFVSDSGVVSSHNFVEKLDKLLSTIPDKN